MISPELIERINYLWHKSRTTGLTPEEKEEQLLAREKYLDAMRNQVRGMMEDMGIPKKGINRAHLDKCSCKNCKN